MATIDVSKAGNPITALKRLKRMNERQGSSGQPKFSDRHIKPSEKRRRAKLAAIKRQKKKDAMRAKVLAGMTQRYKKLSIKQIMEKIS